jgi:predicted nuclease of predicted toxin-antitoxin system
LTRIKLDENLSRYLKPELERHGHDVHTAAEEGLLGKSDVVVGDAARRETRMLFTLDIEFADMRKHPPGNHAGIVLFRPRSMGPLAVNRFVLELVQNTDLNELSGCIAVVEPTRVRIRRQPLDVNDTD